MANVVKTHGPPKFDQTVRESKPKRTKPTPVNVLIDSEGSVLEVVSGPDVVLPERVNGRKAQWISVGHDPMCPLLFSGEAHKIKVRKRRANFGGATMELKTGERLDRVKAPKPGRKQKERR